MTSLARRTREAKLAALRAGTPLSSSTPKLAPAPVESGYRMLLEQLGEDLRELSNTQSIELKIAKKRTMIDRYRPWVDGVLLGAENGVAHEDEILSHMLLWYLDVHDWIMALQVGAHVLSHGLSLPERFKRTPGTVIAEEVADAALKDITAVDYGTLIATSELTEQQDMPDEVRAKLFKAIGRVLVAEADAYDPEAETATAGGKPALLRAALEAYARALGLDDRAGVKKDMESLERELKKLAEPAT